GKTVIPFATSGSSSITGSVRDLRRLYPEVKWQDGKLLNCSAKDAAAWAKTLR
ncbi:MAG: flavodoxin, partial [Bacteroidales bacterium]|nr:flavodoxin [Bacteroidales bacterium]